MWLSVAWKVLFALLCGTALVMDLWNGAWVLNYYTVLSNLLCFAYFVFAIFRGTRPRTEGLVVFCIAVTGIIYATLLAPAHLAEGGFFAFENMVMHYVGPAMVVLDWLLFCPKGRLRWSDPLAWLLAPLGYFAYILVRSTFAGDIGTTGTAFPYDFIDPAVHGGWGPMLIEVLFLAVGMAVLGYVIYALDRFLLHIKK